MNPGYSFSQIAEITGGKILVNTPEHDWFCRRLLIDSRKIAESESALFIAIKGERNDGHGYVQSIFNQGVTHFLVSEFREEYKTIQGSFVVVANTLDALQKLAAFHRKSFTYPVIGITGSNGKTIVKEWLFQLLSQDKNIVRSPKSYNSQVGVPLSVWDMKQEHELGIFEAGVSFPGEMQHLQKIIDPTIGIITNVGNAHAENFQDDVQKVREKLALFHSSKLLIYSKDYQELQKCVSDGKTLPPSVTLFSWSRKTNADLVISKVTKEPHGSKIQGIFQNDFIDITIPFLDDASIENAVHCWALMLSMEIPADIIRARMLMLTPVAMRLEMKEGTNNCSIINDSYNSDIGSLTIALDFLNQQKQHIQKTLILSDILQTGKNLKSLYREVAEMISNKGVTRIIGVGADLLANQELFVGEKRFFHSTDELLKALPDIPFKDEAILIKGARIFGFERVSRELQKKAHQTLLEVNLTAVVNNLNYFRSRLKPETKIMAMVKAFSYGSGSYEIANVLQFHHVDYLSVAYADEGVDLRKAGITLPIMVMNPEEQSFESIIQHNLEPEIYSFRILAQFNDALRRTSSLKAGRVIPIHIKIDTGMHRLGFNPDEVQELLAKLGNMRTLKPVSVFTHLAASEEAAHDSFTKHQAETLRGIAETMNAVLPQPVFAHVLNSTGIIRFPQYQFNMVRLGIGLYGVSSSANEQKHLQNVGSLKTVISQIRQLPANETVGYSRKGASSKARIIATVAIGYADGVNRRLGNGVGKMLVNGSFVPTVGNICMDMCMLDVSNIQAKEGDEVIVFGNDLPIYEFAANAEMSPYEALTSVSQRVKRVFYQE